jgi:hypothetical protein
LQPKTPSQLCIDKRGIGRNIDPVFASSTGKPSTAIVGTAFLMVSFTRAVSKSGDGVRGADDDDDDVSLNDR